MLVVVSLQLVSLNTATAQNGALGGNDAVDPIAALKAQFSVPDMANLTVEGAVDGGAYIVGPGDVFSVSIGGGVPIRQSIGVGADGLLLIPDGGSLNVAGLTLDGARLQISEALTRLFENVAVNVSLEKPRHFFVHVTGAVPLPGKYLAGAVYRVDDAIQLAYSRRAFDLEVLRSGRTDIQQEAIDRALPYPTSERPPMPPEYRTSLRGIVITHLDGSTSSVDLMRYYATGNKADNPYLLDGDVINVSSYHEERNAIRVSGPVPYPGTYPFREGDMLTDILPIVNGSTDISDIGEVRIVSRTVDGPRTRTVFVTEILSGAQSDVALMPGDYVRISEEELDSAGLFGWVKYPATYPIIGGETTITELFELGGGLRPDADLRRAFVDRYDASLLKGDAGTTDLDFFSRTFFARSKGATRLHVDVAAILRGETEDFVLENADTIIIPRIEETVYVVGNVIQGGYVPFVEGKTAAYYIERAGGEAPLSLGVYVMDPTSGRTLKGDSTPVAAGATVYVDREGFAETPELQSLLLTERTSRRQLKLASTQTVISGITAITAIVTTVIAITR